MTVQGGAADYEKRRWKPKPRELRMLLYLLAVLAVAAWKFIPRPWHPTLTLDTAHHRISSTATKKQTEATARALDLLYGAYSNRCGTVTGFKPEHPKLLVKLFKDRTEFRRINPGLGWAEAFYREPYCRAYYSGDENNPYHWMLHEAVHQLNNEVGHLKLEKWLEEGLAEYFSSHPNRAVRWSLARPVPGESSWSPCESDERPERPTQTPVGVGARRRAGRPSAALIFIGAM